MSAVFLLHHVLGWVNSFGNWPIGIIVRIFVNGSGDWGLIPGQVIPRLKKLFLLNTQHYKVRIKCKWSYPGKRVAPLLIPWCSSYWKGRLWVILNYCWSTYLFAGWLVGWFLLHINLCRLFNAKSIFMQVISSISNNSV